MKEEQIIELSEKYLDLFNYEEEKFRLFVESFDSDYLKIKKHLKSLRNEQKKQTFVYKNFDLWSELIEGVKSVDFPTHKAKKKIDGKWRTVEQKRYSYEKDGKDAFRFKLFISDFLEAKAMADCPGSPKARYSMLKSELIKYLRDEKPKEVMSIQAVAYEQKKADVKEEREALQEFEEKYDEIVEKQVTMLQELEEEEKSTLTRLPVLDDGVDHINKELHPDLHED